MGSRGSLDVRIETERLVEFRAGLHGLLTGWPDATFELVDAVLCASGPVSSVPALSLEPVFRRSHGSLYKALSRGGVAADAIRDLLAANRPTGWPPVFAVDASTWARCDAETSPERGFYYSASRHSAGQPIVAGWSYEWISQLDWAGDSWTAPLDARRLRPGEDAAVATAEQVRGLVARLGDTGSAPVFVFDAGYDPIALTHELAATTAAVVVRIRDDRVFYTDPPPHRPGSTGRPRRHGHRHSCAHPDSWPEPDETLLAEDPRYGTARVAAWHGLHPKLGCRGHWAGFDQPPIVSGTVIRVEVAHLPKPTSRSKKTLWLWAACGHRARLDLDLCWRAYLRRFDIEHTFRFLKNTLGWTTPPPAHPRAGRHLDLAHRRRLHPAAPSPRPRRQPTPALGTTTTTRQTHPRPRPTRVSATWRSPGHTRQPTETQESRPRPPQRHPHRPTNPAPGRQERSLTAPPWFNRKLRAGPPSRNPSSLAQLGMPVTAQLRRADLGPSSAACSA